MLNDARRTTRWQLASAAGPVAILLLLPALTRLRAGTLFEAWASAVGVHAAIPSTLAAVACAALAWFARPHRDSARWAKWGDVAAVVCAVLLTLVSLSVLWGN